MLTRLARLVPWIVVLTALALCPALSTQVTKQLASGVTLFQDINTDPANALIVNVITVDPANPAVKVKAALAGDTVHAEDATKGREKVSTITSRRGALVGINADFFPFTGDPLGLCIIDGELVSEPAGEVRAAIGMLKDGGVFFDKPILSASLSLTGGVSRQIDGINRPRETNQILVYSEAYGASTQGKYKGTELVLTSGDLPVRVGKTITLTVSEVRADSAGTPIPKGGMVISAGGPAAWFLKENVKPGDALTVRFDIKSQSGRDWSLVEQAVGGGPWLVKDGGECIDGLDECFKSAFCSTNHPRTAIGATADGKLLLVTVDGRQSGISSGISLPNLAALMRRFGATNAINLDGGGSTTMSVKGLVVNSPCEGIERLVSNALLVMADLKEKELPKLAVSGIEGQATAGENSQMFLTWGDDHQAFTDDQLKHAVWGTNSGVGFMNQAGSFIPVRARKGSVGAFFGKQVAKMDLTVLPGPAAKLDVTLNASRQDPLHSAVSLVLTDAQGNRLAGREVALSAVGGKLGVDKGTTDDKGEFATAVTWEPATVERTVKATVDTLSQTVIFTRR